MIKNWITKRIKERTSLDGAVLIALGLMILFLVTTSEDCCRFSNCLWYMDNLEE